MGKVRVACRHVNGLSIRLYKPGWDDGTGDGVRPLVPDGPPVRLAGPSGRLAGVNSPDRHDDPAITEVDADWMERWMAQNRGHNALVDHGLIYIVGPVEEPACPSSDAHPDAAGPSLQGPQNPL